MEEIKDVWNLPDKSDKTYAYKLELLVWYVGKLLPYCVGNEWLPTSHLHYKTIVDPVQVEIGNKDAKKVPAASATSEAMAWVIYENCFDKWVLICNERSKDHTWKVPKYNKSNRETHKWHKTKWSDPNGGKAALAGWKPAAHGALKEAKRAIMTIRRNDAENKFQLMKLVLRTIREQEGITATEPGNKRKRAKKVTTEPVVYADYDDDDEEECYHDDDTNTATTIMSELTDETTYLEI